MDDSLGSFVHVHKGELNCSFVPMSLTSKKASHLPQPTHPSVLLRSDLLSRDRALSWFGNFHQWVVVHGAEGFGADDVEGSEPSGVAAERWTWVMVADEMKLVFFSERELCPCFLVKFP